MPIGNQEIWDKGIGAGATNVIFGQPAQTNFNPGALGADPNAQAAIPAAATAAAPGGGAAFESWNVQPGTGAGSGAAVPNEGVVPENYSGQKGAKFYVNGQEVSPEQYQQYKEQLRNESNQKVMNFAMSGGGSSNPALRAGGRLMSG